MPPLRRLEPPAAPPCWRAARLLSAPHRLGFFAAAWLLGITALWWVLVLGAAAAGLVIPWAVPRPLAHGLLMAMAFMPLFIVGFLFTAGPRWLGLPEVDARVLLRPVLAFVLGWHGALVGFHVSAPLAGTLILLAAAGWAALLGRFVQLLRASRVADQLHPRAVAVAGALGVLALGAAGLGLVGGQIPLARAAVHLALWGWLTPSFVIVSHRMLPFFDTDAALPRLDAWRPNWLLEGVLAALALTATGAVAEAFGARTGRASQVLLLGVQAATGLLLLWLALRWGRVHRLHNRLLVMLHGGFIWLGAAFALSAGSHARVFWLDESASFGLAPLHALGMGYLGATLLAMTTRVVAAHSGRPLAADALVWALYGVLQLAALLRVTAALWPAGGPAVALLAATAWALACVGWALRYGAWMGRPRVDGRTG